MNADAAKTAREQSGLGPHVVDLRERVPQMSDEALETLLGNARRLAGSGTVKQQTSAADLIPVLETEMTARETAKADAAAAMQSAAAAKRSVAAAARLAARKTAAVVAG